MTSNVHKHESILFERSGHERFHVNLNYWFPTHPTISLFSLLEQLFQSIAFCYIVVIFYLKELFEESDLHERTVGSLDNFLPMLIVNVSLDETAEHLM